MTYKILVVDDEAANLRLLERLFRRQFEVISALSGLEALELLKQHNVSLIISDQRMPGMTGIEFLKQAALMRQHTVRIILTGYTDVNALAEAINSGVVYKYVTKPWVNEDLQQTVIRALQYYETNKKQHELKIHNQRLTQTLKETQEGFIRFIADTLDLRDENAHGHARRTANYAVAVGRRFGLVAEELEQLSLAAYLHEAGYLGMNKEIFRQMPEFTNEENLSRKANFERIVKSLVGVPQINEIASAIHHQYEFFDGAGFPEGLAGKQIPLYSRIISIACAYDKMTSRGLSENVVTHEEAVQFLRANGGKQFDDEVVEIFSELKPLGKIRRAIFEISDGRKLFSDFDFSEERQIKPDELLRQVKTELLAEITKLSLKPETDEPFAPVLIAGELSAEEQKIEKWLARSIRLAEAAKLLAVNTNFINSDEAYTLGLLFNIGEFLLAELYPSEMRAVEEFDEKAKLQHLIENFGVDPAQVSQWLLEACGLPFKLTRAVKVFDELKRVNEPIGLLMMVAEQIRDMSETNKVSVVNSISPDVLETLNLNRTDLNRIYERFAAISESPIKNQPEKSDLMLEIPSFS